MIRLQRLGKSKHPSYRVIVSEKTKDPQAGHVEILGTYNPTLTPKVIDFNLDRIAYWMSVGAKPSPTIHNLLVQLGAIKEKKQRAVHVSDTRRAALAKKAAEAAPKAPAAPVAA